MLIEIPHAFPHPLLCELSGVDSTPSHTLFFMVFPRSRRKQDQRATLQTHADLRTPSCVTQPRRLQGLCMGNKLRVSSHCQWILQLQDRFCVLGIEQKLGCWGLLAMVLVVAFLFASGGCGEGVGGLSGGVEG